MDSENSWGRMEERKTVLPDGKVVVGGGGKDTMALSRDTLSLEHTE